MGHRGAAEGSESAGRWAARGDARRGRADRVTVTRTVPHPSGTAGAQIRRFCRVGVRWPAVGSRPGCSRVAAALLASDHPSPPGGLEAALIYTAPGTRLSLGATDRW